VYVVVALPWSIFLECEVGLAVWPTPGSVVESDYYSAFGQNVFSGLTQGWIPVRATKTCQNQNESFTVSVKP